jgi:hypothetical protein
MTMTTGADRLERDAIVSDRNASPLDTLLEEAIPAEVDALLADSTNHVLDAIEADIGPGPQRLSQPAPGQDAAALHAGVREQQQRQEHQAEAPERQLERPSKAVTGAAHGDALPAHLQTIATVAAAHPTWSLAELATHLFDQHLYRAHAKDGTEVPVNRGTLQRWLDRAKQAGLL